MKTTLLILEDDPERIALFAKRFSEFYTITFVCTADEAISLFKNKDSFDLIFLDHDLGGKTYVDSSIHNTGYTVAKHLANIGSNGRNVILHSMNSVGTSNMKSVLPLALILPFPVLIKNILSIRRITL